MQEKTADQITLLLLCMARDCAQTLPKFFTFLQELETKIGPCVTLVGENGSVDGTRILILNHAHLKVHLVDTSFIASEPHRLRRMAMGREALLETARRGYSNARYICVADLDNVMLAPPAAGDVAAMLAMLEMGSDLFSVGVSSTPYYYDLLSLRAKEWDFAHLQSAIRNAQKTPLTYHHFHKKEIYEKQRAVTQKIPMRCASSFNGMCFYKASMFFRGSYRSPQEVDICEHLSLNLSIGAETGCEMLISDRIKLLAPDDHKPTDLISFWLQRLRKVLRTHFRR